MIPRLPTTVIDLAAGAQPPAPVPVEVEQLFQDARVFGFTALPAEKKLTIGRWAIEHSCKPLLRQSMTPSLLRTMEACIDRALHPHLPRVYAACRRSPDHFRVVDVDLHERTP